MFVSIREHVAMRKPVRLNEFTSEPVCGCLI